MFEEGKFVVVLGGFHIEMAQLRGYGWWPERMVAMKEAGLLLQKSL